MKANWQTPWNLTILLGTVLTIVAAVAGWTGYQLGLCDPPPQPTVVNKFYYPADTTPPTTPASDPVKGER